MRSVVSQDLSTSPGAPLLLEGNLDNASPPDRNHWLYTLVGSDYEGSAAMLPHWLDHYLLTLGYNKDKLILVINHNTTRPASESEASAVISILEGRDIPFIMWKDRYSSDAHLKIKLKLLQEKVTDPEDWITIADSDEFHGYGLLGGTATSLVAQAEEAGANVVMGQMVDRVSSTGELTPIRAENNIFDQFPFNCQVVKHLSGGHTSKVVAFKAYLRTNTGNHWVVTPDMASQYFRGAPKGIKNLRGGWMGAEDLWSLTPYSRNIRKGSASEVVKHKDILPVYHMKWHKGVVQSAADRLEHYRGSVDGVGEGVPRYAHYKESAKIVNALKDGGRLDLDLYGCRDIKNHLESSRLANLPQKNIV